MLSTMMVGKPQGKSYANRVELFTNRYDITVPIAWVVPAGVTRIYCTYSGATAYAHKTEIGGQGIAGAGGSGGGYRLGLDVTPGNTLEATTTGGVSTPVAWTITDTTLAEIRIIFETGFSTLSGGGNSGAISTAGMGGLSNATTGILGIGNIAVGGGAAGVSSSTGAGTNGGVGAIANGALGGFIFSGGGGGGGGDLNPQANGGNGGAVGSYPGNPTIAPNGGGGASVFRSGQNGYGPFIGPVSDAFFIIEYD